MKTEKTLQRKRRGRGRPKGSKSDLPFTTFQEAIEYSKVVWERAQYNEISFREISSYMKLHPKKAVRVLPSLKDFYGVVEKTTDNNWRLTDAGKRLAKNDAIALKEIFTKNPMFSELFSSFGNKQVTEGVIIEHIQKKYKGFDAEEVKKRLMEGIDIIKQGSTYHYQDNMNIHTEHKTVLPLFQLRYALKPATKEEIDALVSKAVKILEESGDETLKLLAELMHEKKKDNQELANLLDKAMKKLKIDYSKEAKKWESKLV